MRILVIRLSSLGDIVLTQPVLAELRELFPDAEIRYVCKPRWAELVRLFGVNAQIVPYQKNLKWHLRMLGQRWDLVLDLHSKFASWLLRSIVHGRKAVYGKQRRIRLRIVRGDRSLAADHTVKMYHSALRKLFPDKFSEQNGFRYPRLYINGADFPQPDGQKAATGRQRVGLFLGAAHGTKIYPLDYWREFIRANRLRYDFFLLGDARDAAISSALIREFPEVKDLCAKLELTALVEFIAGCDAIISGDSGPMHLAAALGKPQLAIFGGTHPRLGFAPLNPQAKVLCADLDCQPCSLHGLDKCPRGHFDCMRSIKPEQLSAALDGMLSGQGR